MSEEEAEGFLSIPPAREFPVEPVFALDSEEPLHQLQPTFVLNSLGISQSQQEASSVLTSGLDNVSLQPPSIEDFLEIDDLTGTREPTFGNIEKPVEKTPFEQVDGLSELDMLHDAAMFLRDIGHLHEENSMVPEMDLLNYGMVNESNYQVQQHPLLVAGEGANQLLIQEQAGYTSSSVVSMQVLELHPSGTLPLIAENLIY